MFSLFFPRRRKNGRRDLQFYCTGNNYCTFPLRGFCGPSGSKEFLRMPPSQSKFLLFPRSVPRRFANYFPLCPVACTNVHFPCERSGFWRMQCPRRALKLTPVTFKEVPRPAHWVVLCVPNCSYKRGQKKKTGEEDFCTICTTSFFPRSSRDFASLIYGACKGGKAEGRGRNLAQMHFDEPTTIYSPLCQWPRI